MRKMSLSLIMTVAVTLGFGACPAMAQTAPAPSLLSGFLNKQKPAPLQTQTVTPNSAYYDEAKKKALEFNKKAAVAMNQAHQADTAKRVQDLEAMFAAERAKAIAVSAAAAAERAEGAPGSLAGPDGVAPGDKKPLAAPANAVRVYAPKKDTSGDKPRRLFNVREQ